MKTTTRRRLLYLTLPLLVVLHGDFWWWHDASTLLGLPIGLSYHILFCLAVSLVMWGLVESGLSTGSESESIPADTDTNRRPPS